MYREVTIILLLFFGLSLKAQIGNDQISIDTRVFQKEIPEIIINSDLLLAGERLYFKVFNLAESGMTSSLSKMSYVTLRTDRDSVIFNHKLKLENGSANGSFFVPTSLATGKYSLFCYTNFSLNNEENALAKRMINIVNPFVKLPAEVQKDSTRAKELLSSNDVVENIAKQSSSNGISIFVDKPTYKRREKISLKIENPNGKFGHGNYTLSVRKVDPVKISNRSPSDGRVEIAKENVFYIPEIRGELLSGRVLTVKGNEPVTNKKVALSIPGEKYVFKTASTNVNGRFFISIDEPYETNAGIFEIDEPDKAQYKIVLDTKEFKFEGEVFPSLKLDPNLKPWLQERSIQLQIQDAYFRPDSVVVAQDSSTPFYGKLGTLFVLDDYTRFPTFEETFIEIVTLARIRKRDGKRVFEVFNPFNPYKSGPYSSAAPLLLLDGILVQDEQVLSYSAKDIESIRVFPEPYRYGPKIFRGIIDFKTKKRDFKPVLERGYIREFELLRPLPSKGYYGPDHSNMQFKRVPDYRTQLFWEPNIQLSSNEIVQTFYTSDVVGRYEIILEGYTREGKHIKLEQYFLVGE